MRGGLKVQQDAGWVGWGLGKGRMWGSYTAIVKAPPGAGAETCDLSLGTAAW